MPYRRAVIFVNGDLRNADRLRRQLDADDYLVSADGGLRHLHKLGLPPHLLIGDLDSVPEKTKEDLQRAGIEVRQYPVQKDETDLELALQTVLEMGFVDVLIVAALGGRLDQTLGNLFLLLQNELAGVQVRMDDGLEEVFLIRADAFIQGESGDRVSLLALNGPVQGVRTEGLAYPLDGETLWPDKTRGISNQMQSVQARVSLETGTLLCIHRRGADEKEMTG